MKHVPASVWQQFNTQVGASFRLGEWLGGEPSTLAAAWRDGAFTAMFDFPLAFAANDVFCKGDDVQKLGAVLTNDRRVPDPSQWVTLLDNHDLPRIVGQCGGRMNDVKDAWAFLLTARGIPSLTWGDEVGFDGMTEPGNRPSMRFDEQHPLRAWLTQWFRVRREHPALQDGASVVLASRPGQLVIGRAHPNELAIVVIGESSAMPAVPKAWSARTWTQLPERSTHVAVWVAKPDTNELVASTDAQWRRGVKTKRVHFDGPADTFLVGSGAELGDWNPAKALPLPADVVLPVGGVFSFKRIHITDGKPVWPDTKDEMVFVGDGMN